MSRALDRSLDEIASTNARGYRGGRDRRQNNWPRDGVRKSSQRDEPKNLDQDWVHDRFDDDDSRRPTRGPHSQRDRIERYAPESDQASGVKLRVENLHYELSEDDLKELFERIGRVQSVQLLYDRHDRSKGVGFVTYYRVSDARAAIDEFNGANAKGQPIRLSLVPQPAARQLARNPFDYVDVPARSLFDRIENTGTRRRGRSSSPDTFVRHSDVSKPPPSNIDRYIPGQRRRSPPRRGSGRESGRRPGARREQSGRREDTGRPIVQGRPRKTQQELDAEMEDYWGKGTNADESANGHNGNSFIQTAAAAPANTSAPVDDDIDMIE
ncbi:RNA-binding domain-containing protein [Patellaria atrata CBS 101060]|uniref:RNA-binding domain-containing protein n=1 Tax=Patellaria atrata CBS 101060 TaxID=1346257 RepID=A0A9P4SIP8_9PEZI|nr:RNA-binding domain-containing protein [Patellaria atrata CBS 101060]